MKQALKNNPNTKGLIHQNDRGVQYCCSEYVEILQKNHIKISMTEKGDPLENPIAERVNGILKTEILEETYHSFEQAKNGVALAISTYNHLQPHNSIGDFLPLRFISYMKLKSNGLWKNYYTLKAKEVTMELV